MDPRATYDDKGKLVEQEEETLLIILKLKVSFFPGKKKRRCPELATRPLMPFADENKVHRRSSQNVPHIPHIYAKSLRLASSSLFSPSFILYSLSAEEEETFQRRSGGNPCLCPSEQFLFFRPTAASCRCCRFKPSSFYFLALSLCPIQNTICLCSEEEQHKKQAEFVVVSWAACYPLRHLV